MSRRRRASASARPTTGSMWTARHRSPRWPTGRRRPDRALRRRIGRPLRDPPRRRVRALRRAARADRARPLHDGVRRRAVLEAAAVEDPTRVKRLAVRFSAPVFPGEIVTTRVWQVDGGVRLRIGQRRREAGDQGRPGRASMSIDLEHVVAIDVHTHAEVGRGGQDGLRPEWREAAVEYFGEDAKPTVDDVAAYYRERKMAAVVFSVDAETVTGRRPFPNEEIADAAAANDDVLIPFASRRPTPSERCRGGAPPRRRPPRPWIQVPPQHPGVLSERPHVLPDLRGDRGGGRARSVPHRALAASVRASRGAAGSGSSTRTRCTSTMSPSTFPS